MTSDAAASSSAGPTGWLARIPLRVTLVAALVLLMSGTLLATGYAATSALRTYLLGQLDDDVQQASDQMARALGARSALEESQFPGSLPGVGGQVLLTRPVGAYVQLTDTDGQEVEATPLDGEPDPDLTADQIVALAEGDGEPTTVDSVEGDSQWRTSVASAGDNLVVVAYPLDDVDATVGRLRTINLIVGAVALIGLGIAGYSVVRSSLRPLDTIEETAAAIASGNLDRRIPYQSKGTEVGRLGSALNGMLAQIESAFRAQRASEAAARASEDRMRQFVADAGHELRTPLTSIRGYAELVRQGAVETVGGQTQVVRRIEDSAADMGVLVDDLLLLARLDQHRPLERQPVDLLALTSDAVHDARARDPERPIELRAAGGPMPPIASGDETRLRQVVGNLVSNALTHTSSETEVTVSVGTQAGAPATPPVVWLEVRDHGPGLAPHQLDRVFERFYRGDDSRSRDSGGIGLGLAIVASIVTAHRGTVSAASEPGSGACFRVELPGVAPTSHPSSE